MKKIILAVVALLILVYAGCKKKSDDNPPRDCTWSNVFSDDFNRADGPIGSNYHDTLAGAGFVDILNGQLRVSTSNCYWAIWYATEVDGNKTRVSIKCRIPESGGPHAFAIGGKFTKAGQMIQSGYFGGVMQGRVVIMKISGGPLLEMAGENYTLQASHTYQLVLTFDDNVFTLTISDVASKNTITVTATETGTLLTGKTYTINGNTIGGADELLFDDYLIERCQ